MSKNVFILGLIQLCFVGGVHAQTSTSAADALLKTLNSSVSDLKSIEKQAERTSIQEEIKLENPMARQLFNDWSNQTGLSYEFNSWIKAFFANRFESFSHLKSSMAAQTDSLSSQALRHSIEAAYLYSLFRMNLAQTFMDSWISAMENQAFLDSRGSAALDEGIASLGSFDEWMLSKKVNISSTQELIIKKIGTARHPNWLSLNAFAFQRKGLMAEEFLPKLAVNSPFRPRLSMTVALAYAKKGDLATAAKTLKVYYEPWVNQSKDAVSMSQYYLQIARLLYQVGALDGAIQYYEKIPNGSKDYITAHEELAWCLLRKGDLSKLRGNLATLNSSVLSDQFRPESYLVKSISDLKLCYYSDVEKDFSQFLKQHQPWAKKIEAAIQAPESLEPRVMDEFSKLAVESVKEKQSEISMLQGLAERSASAALPAVGQQKHWTQAIQQMQANLEIAKKRQADEFRRQWKSDKSILSEAIRKMQFVKVELLSQVSQIEKASTQANTSSPIKNEMKEQVKASADHSFPFDGVVWPDELFKLRSVTQGQCVGQM